MEKAKEASERLFGDDDQKQNDHKNDKKKMRKKKEEEEEKEEEEGRARSPVDGAGIKVDTISAAGNIEL